MFKGFFTVLVLISFVASVHGQDPIYSQYYAAPLQTNPAFTGQTFGPYLNLNYRTQLTTHTLVPAYVTYNLGYSQFIDRLNIGLGLMLQNNNSGGGILQTNIVRGYFSYVLRLKNNYKIRWGVEAGMIQSNLDWGKLLFLDQIDPQFGPDGSRITNEVRPDNLNKTLLDVGSGLLFYNKLLYIGITVKHINTPKDQWLQLNNNLFSGIPVRYALQVGAQINVTRGNKALNRAFLFPHLLIVKQGTNFQFNVGAHYKYKSVIGGLSFRHSRGNGDSFIPLIGFEKRIFKLGFSYDFILSGLRKSGGVQEISVIINLDKSHYYKRQKYEKKYSDCFGLFR